MSNTNAIEKVRPQQLDGWSALAADAGSELEETIKRAKQLKLAIRIFRENAQRGEFYPEPSSDQPIDS